MAESLVAQLFAGLGGASVKVDIALCPPFPLLQTVVQAEKDTPFNIGAQDCSAKKDGAYTGDVSAAMLKDMGCTYVILGHSERREYHAETDRQIAAKMMAAHAAGLIVILCVGEKDASTSEDMKMAIVRAQLQNSMAATATAENTVIAYEPVWAIGSGLTPTPKQIEHSHAFIAAELPPRLKGARVLYGGSVNDKNAAEILAIKGVDGALVGGASLKVDSFLKIIASA